MSLNVSSNLTTINIHPKRVMTSIFVIMAPEKAKCLNIQRMIRNLITYFKQHKSNPLVFHVANAIRDINNMLYIYITVGEIIPIKNIN